MARYECFLVQPTFRAQKYLRRYRGRYESPADPLSNHRLGIHNASVFVGDADLHVDPKWTDMKVYDLVAGEAVPHDDSRWPTRCDECDYLFEPADQWQVRFEQYYQRVDTGAVATLEDMPPGAMWDAEWWRDGNGRGSGPDGLSLHVKLPDNSIWFIDGPASNCTAKDVKHNCWVRTGEPPKLTIVGGANLCGVGGGSIMTAHYHGFLQDGWLVD